MSKKTKKLLAVLFSVLLCVAFLVGCTTSTDTASSAASESAAPASSESAASASSTDEAAAGEEPSITETYTIGYNNFGKGAYPIDIVEADAQYFASVAGNTIVDANDEFKAEKTITNVQNLISSGIDGMIFMGAVETTIPTACDMLAQAGVPFVMHDKVPTDQDVLDNIVNNNEYFAGVVAAQNVQAGAQIGEKAAEDGCKTAIIVAAVQGDPSHDDRIKGFTEAFENAGGEVIGVAHCADPTEGVTKASDLITANPDADCIYGSGGDYSNAAINALANFPESDMKIYGTDIDPDLVELLAEGKVAAVNGGFFVESGIASALLQNYLDGHPILDENGNPPVLTNLQMILLPADRVDDYTKYWIDGNPLTEEQYKSLMWRYNPDVSYQTFYDICENFTLDSVVEAHQAIGD